MTFQEKITLIVNLIKHKFDAPRPFAPYTGISLKSEPRLSKKITKHELSQALDYLEFTEQIIQVLRPSKIYKEGRIIEAWEVSKTTGEKILIPQNEEDLLKKFDFLFIIHPYFPNWLNSYQAKLNRKIEDLSEANMQKIHNLVCKFDDKFQLVNSPNITITAQYSQQDSLKFLYDKSILLNFSEKKVGLGEIYEINVVINFERFMPFVEEIKQLYQKTKTKHTETQKVKPSSTNDPDQILYQISFSMNYEVILNDLVILSKPNLDSENAEVFAYLLRNPNKEVLRANIETEINKDIKKDFHKIVDNLGFGKDLKKTFFHISKNTILFRNPITQSQFEKLGIPPLKVIQKPI
ncbi:MAG: hypothetical protein JNN05_11115 [Candidatus Omnitrophica bacterium]|nr:hypothetical protein [Candidatus Omnitrophota bacterium]